ncbi:HGGxSTG domain-containing protein [Novosphingobium tardum]|uniref:HGGxSTG domain-containing protein n=1 Tax=Novosphingobium tardum TaxID=1538021 RepID=A0ABV8RKU2_9SPHN
MHLAPRCLAKTRGGTECQAPAVRGRKRCRMHGGKNPGAPKGNRRNWKHGLRSAEHAALKATVRALCG